MPERLEVDALTVDLDAGRKASVSFELDAGACSALRGPSGSGKTTLLRGIAHLAPSRGTVRLGGRTARDMGVPGFRRRVVYVAQRPTMLSGTVRANLERAFAYTTSSRPFELDAAANRLVALGLEQEILDRTARDLSVGEQQRVALVRAILVAPAFLLLDEPTSALDTAAVSAVEEMLLDLRNDGVGIVLVTHHDEQAERLGAISYEVVA